MDRKLVLQVTAVAASVGLVAVLGEAAAMLLAQTSLQPTIPPVPQAVFEVPINSMPQLMLAFFAADSLFVLSYLLLYAGLYAETAGRAPVFAALGLGAGIFGALCDATENAFMISYATLSLAGHPVAASALPLIFVLANLKWMGAILAFAAFGLVFPREDAPGKALSVLMLLPALLGTLAVVWAPLYRVLGFVLLAGLVFLTWYFWRAVWRMERLPKRRAGLVN